MGDGGGRWLVGWLAGWLGLFKVLLLVKRLNVGTFFERLRLSVYTVYTVHSRSVHLLYSIPLRRARESTMIQVLHRSPAARHHGKHTVLRRHIQPIIIFYYFSSPTYAYTRPSLNSITRY